MDRDKAFGIYAITLICAVASVITASVMAGFATLPSPMMFVEHVALGLGIRFAYKWVGGVDVADWTIFGEPIEKPVAATEAVAQGGVTADATS